MREFLRGLLANGVIERVGADGFALLAFLACHEQPVSISRAELASRVGLSKRTVVELVRKSAEAGFLVTTPGSGRAPEQIAVVGITACESRTSTTISLGVSSGDVLPVEPPLVPPKPVVAEVVETPKPGVAVVEAPTRPEDASGLLFDLGVETEAVRSTPSARRVRVDAGSIPESLNTAEFLAKWAEWLKYRTERRQSVTKTTARLQLAKLAKHGVAAAIWALDVSMFNGWQGLFPENYVPQGSMNGTRTSAPAKPGRVVRGRRVNEY